jgi:hypothetical protein
VLTTDQKGVVAETAIAHAAAKLGIPVFRPLAPQRYDFVFDFGTRFVRVQCKWAVHMGAVVLVRCRRCRRGRDGLIHAGYSPDEIDAFAAYCAELERCFYLPVDLVRGRKAIHLRLAAARNNQRTGVNWADDFDFDRLHWDRLKGP